MPKCKEDGGSSGEMTKVINLVLISLSNLFGGVSLSLLSPFYSAEALLKGVSVTKSGLVFGSVFVTTVLCTPVIGRYIEVLGARRFLLLGSAICALGNVAFGTLCLVQVYTEVKTVFGVLDFDGDWFEIREAPHSSCSQCWFEW